MRTSSRAAVAVAAVIVMLGTWPAAAGAAGSWSWVPTPGSSTTLRQLQAVDCRGTVCVAVGFSKQLPLAERWDGSTWTRMAIPSAPNAQPARLNGVSCSSATSCMAVGHYTTGPNAPVVKKTFVQRWDGTKWRIVPSPNPAGSGGSRLTGVSCLSRTSCVAVGAWGTNSTAADWTLIEHWDGTRWRIVSSPNGPGPSGEPSSKLNGVSCADASYCVAVGNYLNASFQETPIIARWNGTQRQRMAIPSGVQGPNELNGVSCRPTRFCAAVGRRAGPNLTLAVKSTGAAWSRMTVESLPTTHLGANAVSCTSSTNCVAVGELVQRWNGSSWKFEASPSTSDGRLVGVRCLQSRCMAVGFSDGFTPLAMRFG